MLQYRFGRNGQSTGDPWIDAGIVGFFDYVSERTELAQEQGMEEVDSDAFALSADEPSKVEKFVRCAFEEVKNNRYIVKTGNRSLIYDQEQDKLTLADKINPAPIIAALFPGGNLRSDYDKVPFPKHLRPQLEEMQNTYKGNKSVNMRTIDKEGRIFASKPRVAWEIQPSLVPEARARKRKDAQGEETVRPATAVGQCAFCGRDYASSHPHSNNYPFIVATKNWSNFFSQQRLELKMCSLCEAASLFAFLRVFFSVVRRNKIKTIFIAIPHAESLSEMDTFWADARGFIGERTLNDSSNVLDDAFKYTHLHETVLAFAHRVYRGFSEAREGARLREEAETKRWHFYLGKKVGNVLSFDDYVLFDEMERIFRLFDEAAQIRDEQGKPLIDFASMFNSLTIREGNDYNNFYREAIATAILRNRPLTEAAEAFLYKKGATVRGFTEFVKLYHLFRRDGE